MDDAKFFLTFPGVALLPRSLDDRRRKMGDILKSNREPLICIIVDMGISDMCIDWGDCTQHPSIQECKAVCVCVCLWWGVGSSLEVNKDSLREKQRPSEATFVCLHGNGNAPAEGEIGALPVRLP